MRITTTILFIILNFTLSGQTEETFSLVFKSNKFGQNDTSANKIFYVSNQTLNAYYTVKLKKNKINTSYVTDHIIQDTVWRRDTLVIPFRQSSIDSIADLIQIDKDTITKVNPCLKVDEFYKLNVNFNGEHKVYEMYDSFDSTAFKITNILRSYLPRNSIDPRPIHSWRSAQECWEGIKKHRTVYEQRDHEIFRATFYSNFFGLKMKSVSSSLNTYYSTINYKGKKLDKPVHYELYGMLSREMQGVEFKYKLIEVEPPEKLELIKKYYLHVNNLNKYIRLFQFHPHEGYYLDDTLSQGLLDSLVERDIELSSRIKENELGLYLDSSSGKYYIKSEIYCAQVKIRVPFRLTRKGKCFLKRYNYKIDDEEMCKRLLNNIRFCDRDINDYYYQNNFGRDVNCYSLYAK